MSISPFLSDVETQAFSGLAIKSFLFFLLALELFTANSRLTPTESTFAG